MAQEPLQQRLPVTREPEEGGGSALQAWKGRPPRELERACFLLLLLRHVTGSQESGPKLGQGLRPHRMSGTNRTVRPQLEAGTVFFIGCLIGFSIIKV